MILIGRIPSTSNKLIKGVAMKKLINDPLAVVDEMVDGFVAAYPNYVCKLENQRSIVRVKRNGQRKVGIVIGGGSGHEPAFLGYIGKGMADAAAVGNIFASPPPAPILEVTKEIHSGEGVLYLYGNYAGDCMNFDMAAEMASMENIRVESLQVTDDIASAPAIEREKRRGIAGIFLVLKAVGAAADQGYLLDDVLKVARKANESIRTMGVSLSPCTLPQSERPNFHLGENEMEIGLGIHGEPGVEKGMLKPADQVTNVLLENILTDLPLMKGDRVAVLINGLGSTTYLELFIMFRKVEKVLKQKAVTIYHSFVGEYITSLEMGGCSISIMKLDHELAQLMKYPADCPMFVQN
jgi:dihydroxyacetone kinase-like protein